MAARPDIIINNVDDIIPRAPPSVAENNFFQSFRRFFMNENQFNNVNNYAMLTNWISKSFLTTVVNGRKVDHPVCAQFQALVRNDGKILSDPTHVKNMDCQNYNYSYALISSGYLKGVDVTSQWLYK